MRLLRWIMVLGAVLCAAGARGQTYVADFTIGNFVRAYYTDEDGQRWRTLIPNGTVLEVTGRTVDADSTDTRAVKALFEYNGHSCKAEARWLRFSEENGEDVADIFAGDRLSPTKPETTRHLGIPPVEIHSPRGRFLYGMTLPALQLALMVLALFVVLRTGRPMMSTLPFLASTAVQMYLALALDWDALWWCDPQYQGLRGAVAGMIPLLLFLAMEFMYAIVMWVVSPNRAVRWTVMLAALWATVVTLGTVVMVSMWIFTAILAVCPVLAWVLSFCTSAALGRSDRPKAHGWYREDGAWKFGWHDS